MQSDKMLMTTAIALALVAPAMSPAHAADEAAQTQSAQAQTGTQAQQAGEGDKIDIVSWAQEDLYTEGWTAEQLLDQDVYGETGEEAGEVEDLIVGPDGALKAMIVEAGGFLDIGDTHYRVPWEDVQLTPDLEGITVPVTAENVEAYSIFPEDEEEAPERGFRASELMNDYVSLADYPAYGMVQDLVFQDGELSAVVVYPDVGYGIGGPYAYPWYGYEYGWEPGAEAYDLPYTRDEIAELGPFDYDRLRAPWPGARGDMGEEADLGMEEQPEEG
jgi:sporulation protein YlmC with PRC-barrel domain